MQGPASTSAKEQFQPAFTRLVTLLQGRVSYPENFDSLDASEQRDFHSARFIITDTIMDAACEKPYLGHQTSIVSSADPGRCRASNDSQTRRTGKKA